MFVKHYNNNGEAGEKLGGCPLFKTYNKTEMIKLISLFTGNYSLSDLILMNVCWDEIRF